MLHQRVEVGAEGLNVQVALSARTVERSAHGIVKVSAEPEETWPALSMAQTRNRAVVFAGNASEVVSSVPEYCTVPEVQFTGASTVADVERTTLYDAMPLRASEKPLHRSVSVPAEAVPVSDPFEGRAVSSVVLAVIADVVLPRASRNQTEMVFRPSPEGTSTVPDVEYGPNAVQVVPVDRHMALTPEGSVAERLTLTEGVGVKPGAVMVPIGAVVSGT